MSELAYNKTSEIEDFADPELLEIIRTLFHHEPHDLDHDVSGDAVLPQHWLAAMAVRALRNHATLGPDALVLVIGAGLDPTLFYLTNQVRLVFAVDRYLSPEAWSAVTPRLLLLEPEELAPNGFDPQRLVVQHMDGRRLRFPDAMFDGIVALDLVGHAGGLEETAHVAYELGRVLKPGGVLTVGASYRLNGPPGGYGYNGIVLPNLDELQHYVVEASGLEPVDELLDTVSATTLASRRDLTQYAEASGPDTFAPELTMQKDAWTYQPQLVHIHQGYVFSYVHLTLCKTDAYPMSHNDWARPNEATVKAIQSQNQSLLTRPPTPVDQPIATAVIERKVMQRSSESLNQIHTLYQTWDEERIRGWHNQKLRRLPRPLAALGRTFIRVGSLGKVHEAQAQLSNAMLKHHVQVDARIDDAQTRIGDLAIRSDDQTGQLAIVYDQTRQQQQILTSLTGANTRMATVEKQLNEYTSQHQTLLASHQQLSQQVATLEQVLHNLTETQQQLVQQFATAQEQATQLAALDQRVREVVSFTRMVQQQLTVQNLSSVVSSPLNASQAQELIERIEREIPELAAAQAVEVSVQGAGAEQALAALARYFGERSSSRTSPYRYPNDAWYHIDLTADWQRPNLFAGAISRLGLNGRFVLITAEGNLPSKDTAGLELVENRLYTLTGGIVVRMLVWRRIEV